MYLPNIVPNRQVKFKIKANISNFAGREMPGLGTKIFNFLRTMHVRNKEHCLFH